MSHHDIQFVTVLILSLSICSFVILTALRRTRTQGIIGLVGSILLLSGVVREESFHNIQTTLILEILGGAFFLASNLIAIKKRQS